MPEISLFDIPPFLQKSYLYQSISNLSNYRKRKFNVPFFATNNFICSKTSFQNLFLTEIYFAVENFSISLYVYALFNQAYVFSFLEYLIKEQSLDQNTVQIMATDIMRQFYVDLKSGKSFAQHKKAIISYIKDNCLEKSNYPHAEKIIDELEKTLLVNLTAVHFLESSSNVNIQYLVSSENSIEQVVQILKNNEIRNPNDILVSTFYLVLDYDNRRFSVKLKVNFIQYDLCNNYCLRFNQLANDIRRSKSSPKISYFINETETIAFRYHNNVLSINFPYTQLQIQVTYLNRDIIANDFDRIDRELLFYYSLCWKMT